MVRWLATMGTDTTPLGGPGGARRRFGPAAAGCLVVDVDHDTGGEPLGHQPFRDAGKRQRRVLDPERAARLGDDGRRAHRATDVGGLVRVSPLRESGFWATGLLPGPLTARRRSPLARF